MDMKKRMLATLAGFVVFFLLGWILYGMLLMDFLTSNQGAATGVMRADTEMIWWALAVGNLLQAYLLVYIFGNWANITTFGGGFRAGVIIGLIIGYGYDLTMYGTTHIMNLTATLVDPIVVAVMMGISGGVIGVVLGKK
jgi:hypothetical protein